ncbi:hypothetical protein C0992_009761, partial [Termitomyces sp. T32_za158]
VARSLSCPSPLLPVTPSPAPIPALTGSPAPVHCAPPGAAAAHAAAILMQYLGAHGWANNLGGHYWVWIWAGGVGDFGGGEGDLDGGIRYLVVLGDLCVGLGNL